MGCPARLAVLSTLCGWRPPTATRRRFRMLLVARASHIPACLLVWCPRCRCYVATDASLNQALSLGLQRDQLRLYGLPIRPAFGRSFPAKAKLRK